MREVNNETTLKQRVLQLCDYFDISPNKLSENAGYNRNYISRLNDVSSFEFLIHIYRNYERVNIEWLLTGNGKMLLPDVEDMKNSAMVVDLLEREIESNKNLEKELSEMKEKLKKISELATV